MEVIVSYQGGVRKFAKIPTPAQIQKSFESENNRIKKQPPQPSYPLTSTQKRILFIERADSTRSFHNIVVPISINGKFDTELFRRALQIVIDQNPVFDSRFVNKTDGTVVQTHSAGLLLVPVIDLRHLSPVESSELFQKTILSEYRQKFDLENGPLIRSMILWQEELTFKLLITVHHIVFDEWSVEIFSRSLCQAYNSGQKEAGSQGEAINYLDYALWQQTSLQQEHAEYWKRELQDLPVAELPTDFKRSPGGVAPSKTCRAMIEPGLVIGLRRFVQSNKITLFGALHSVLAVLMSKYLRAEDFAIGIHLAGRSTADTFNIIGAFINTLPIRIRMDPDESFAVFSRRVQDTIVAAMERQDFPFDEIVKVVNPSREPGRSPFFDVDFALETDSYGIDLKGLDAELLPADVDLIGRDYMFTVRESKSGLVIRLDYNTSLFRSSTAKDFLKSYMHVLKTVVEQPEIIMCMVGAMAPAESHVLLEKVNAAPPAPQLLKHTLPAIFENTANQFPKKPALCFAKQCLSYDELNCLANRLARELRERIVTGDRVGVFLQRSIESYVSLLAILKAGGVYVPIDPDAPETILSHVLADAKPATILTTGAYREKLRDHAGFIICLDQDKLERKIENNLDLPIGASDLAYLLYTSGSSGVPKGVLAQHCGVSSSVLTMTRLFGLGPGDRCLQFSNLTFDTSLLEIFNAFAVGATLYSDARVQLMDPGFLINYIQTNALTCVDLTPTVWSLIKHAPFSSLRLVLTGGERLPPEVAKEIAKRAKMYNCFGATETTIDVAVHLVTSEDLDHEGIPIGRAFCNRRLYILDEFQNPVPFGVTGEFCVGGQGLSLGYHNQPDLTAERFVPDPFANEQGARMYRTGDLGRVLPDGTIELLGRSDGQVKIRGQRIELGEIENALLGYPGIQQAACARWELLGQGHALAAYVVARETLRTQDLMKFLRDRLMPAAVPSKIIIMKELPIGRGGKLDRKNLRNPFSEPVACQPKQGAQSRSILSAVEEIFRSELKLDSIDINENFFDLGAHSLSLLSVQQAMSSSLGMKCSITDMFQYQLSQVWSSTSRRLQLSTNEISQIKILFLRRRLELRS